MNKLVKESTLRKQLMNRVLNYTPVELLNEICRLGLGIYINVDVDWDVRGGHQAIGIETLPAGEPRDLVDKVFKIGCSPTPR